MNKFRVKINLILYFVVNFMITMVIWVFFMVILVNRRLFRYFGSYSGISVIPVILVNRRTGKKSHLMIWEKNPVGIFKIPTGKNFSHGIFKIPMGFLSLNSYLKPKTKYFLEQNI